MQKLRCPWVDLKNPLYIDYHDNEWGLAVYDDQTLFEFLILEGAQAGLSWQTILNKREGYRKLFADFDPKKVANFSEAKIAKLLADDRIVRNKLKVNSAVINAKAFLKVQQEFGSFADYLWGFVNHKPVVNIIHNSQEYIVTSDISDAISKDLKRRGFKFVGSTIIYAYMQACGLVFDHIVGCCCSWHVYIIQTRVNTLYTGITNNLERRFTEHNSQGPKCAKYLRGKAPLKLVYQEFVGSKSMAAKREAQIKKMSRAQKEDLINK